MKIYFETYGCAANQADEIVMQSLLKDNYEFTENVEDADITIMLTCGVKGSTENKILARLEQLKDKKVIIAGCLTKIITKKLEKTFPTFSLIGPDQINDIENIVKKVVDGEKVVKLDSKKEIKCIIPDIVHETQPIAIATGCLNACA